MIKKIPDVSGLVINTILKAKISEVKNKTPVSSDLVKETNYDTKISADAEGKFITISDYNKFLSDIIAAQIKQKELVNKSDISNLVKSSDLNTQLETLATEWKLKAEQDKIVKLQSHDINYFLGKTFRDDGPQNMFGISEKLIR